MKQAKWIDFCLSEETLTRLNDRIIRLVDAIKQKPYATALALLQVFDPEKAKDVQYALSLSNDPLECTNLLKGRSNTYVNTAKAETKKTLTELADHVGDVMLNNEAVQGTIGLLISNVNEGSENFIRLGALHQSKVLEKIGFGVFNGSEELERKVFTVLHNAKNSSFFRICIRYSRHLKSTDIEKIIKTNGKTLTHLDLSGSEGVTDILMHLLPTSAPHLQALILNGTGVTRIEGSFYLPQLKWLEIDKSEGLNHVEVPFCEVETLILSSKSLEYLAFYSPSLTRLQLTEHGQKAKKFAIQIAAAIETILMLSANLMEFKVPDDITMLTRQATFHRIYRNRMKAVEYWREKDELAPDAGFTDEELHRLLKLNEVSTSPATTIDIRDLNPKLLPSLLHAPLDFKKIQSVHTRPYAWMPKKNNQGEEHKRSFSFSANENNRILEISELPNGNVLVISSDEIPCIVNPSLNPQPLSNVTDNYTSGTYAPNGLFYLADNNDILASNGCGLIARHTLPLKTDENITIIRGFLALNGKTPEIIIGTSLGRLLSLRLDRANNAEKLTLITDEPYSLGITHIVFDGEHLFATATGNTVTLYNRLTMKPIIKRTSEDLGNNMKITALQFIHHKLACGFENGRIAFYAKNDFSEIFSLAPPATNGASVTDIKSIDSYNFVSANDAGYLYLWNQISPTFFQCTRDFKLECGGGTQVFLSVLKNGDIYAFSGNTCNVFYCYSSYFKFDSIKSMTRNFISQYEQVPQYELVQYGDTNTHLQLRAAKVNLTLSKKVVRDLATLSKAQVYQSREANGVVFELINPEICAAFITFCTNILMIRQVRASNQFGDVCNLFRDVFSTNGADLYEKSKKESSGEDSSFLLRPHANAQLTSYAAASSPKFFRTPGATSGRSAQSAANSLPPSPSPSHKIKAQAPMLAPLSFSFHGVGFLKSDQRRLLKLTSLFVPKSGTVAIEESIPANNSQNK